jgi:hypothetical protein
MGCLSQLRNALSGRHGSDQLPEGEGRLYCPLRQLLQRMRNPKGEQEQRRRTLQEHSIKPLHRLQDRLLPTSGRGPGFIVWGLAFHGHRPGQLER